MTNAQRLTLRASEIRSKLNELSGLDSLEDDQRKELDELSVEYRDVEAQRRAAIMAEDGGVTTPAEPDAEMRERVELRSRANSLNYVLAAMRGRLVDGAEAELQEAAGVTDGGIPVELFDREIRQGDAVTESPTTGTGTNLDPLYPQIFARSVLPRVGVAMPRVGSGTYATGTITTSLTAGAEAKGDAREATAGTITTATTTPHRVSARLGLTAEDIALVGVSNFRSIWEENLMIVLSDRLDHLGLTGDNQNANPQGLLAQLTDPTDPETVVDFDGFVKLAADGIDGGPWAETMGSVRLLVNAETMRKAETTFQSATNYKGEMSAAAYLRSHSGMFFSSSRMPATTTNIAQVLRYRAGTMGLEGVNAVRTATCPVWNSISITDIYSASAEATTYVTMHALVGDVLIQQASAYERVDVKVA